eukprot:3542530-Prymnesium_polylepis.1
MPTERMQEPTLFSSFSRVRFIELLYAASSSSSLPARSASSELYPRPARPRGSPLEHGRLPHI